MTDRIFILVIYICVLLIFMLFFWIMADILIKGVPHLSLSFLLDPPANSGRSGGIASILVATAWILLVAFIVALPVGLAVALWLSEFTRDREAFASTTRLTLDILAGVPSIVYGLFGNAFFCVTLGLGFSILSGGLTLACMILPVFIRTSEVGLSAVNESWRKGAVALGMTKSSAIWYILLPAAVPAILTGFILGAGRATAETAALIFTSGYVDRMPDTFMDSGRALAVHIYDLSMNITGGDQAAHASALVLITLILLFNISAQAIADHWLKRKALAS